MENKFTQTIIIYIIVILVLTMGIGVYIISTNLEKRPGWLYLFICIGGVIIGLLIGYLRSDISSGLLVGILMALLGVFSGITGRWQRQKFTELEDWYKKRFKK
jgi:carbon starvation protein CstA